RKLGRELLEVALHEPAAEADRDPVAERLSARRLEPVPGLAHGPTVPLERSLELRPMAIAREAEPVGSLQEVKEAGLDREDLLTIYRNMLVTRGIEERGHILYKQGKIP